jgi:hypothetical protein
MMKRRTIMRRELLVALVVAAATSLVTACARQAEQYAATCASYGHTEGTPQWGLCMQNERMIAAQQSQARAARVAAGQAAARNGTDFMTMGY